MSDALGVQLFVVEDAHWADETTLELMLVLRARRELGPRLVLSYRPEDVGAQSLLRRLFGRAGMTRLEPGPLDTAAIAELDEPGTPRVCALCAVGAWSWAD